MKLNLRFDTIHNSDYGRTNVKINLEIQNNSNDTIYYYTHIGYVNISIEFKVDTSWTEIEWAFLINQIIWTYKQYPKEIVSICRNLINEILKNKGIYRIKLTYYVLNSKNGMLDIGNIENKKYGKTVYSDNFEIK